MATPPVGDRLESRSRHSPERLAWTKDGLLRAFLSVMHTSGENAEADYAQALEFLRREPESTMIAIAGAYLTSPERAYPRRHSLVQAAVALEHEAALPFLADVVRSPIPPEGMPDAHASSTVAEETIIRMSAVDGISAIARTGARQAVEMLISFLSIPSFSIRRAAVMGVLAAPGGARHRRRMQGLIPADQHFIFNMKKVHVRDAVQVKDPRRHLAPHAQEFDSPKPEVLGGRSNDTPTAR
jgi:hypothetical protein